MGYLSLDIKNILVLPAFSNYQLFSDVSLLVQLGLEFTVPHVLLLKLVFKISEFQLSVIITPIQISLLPHALFNVNS